MDEINNLQKGLGYQAIKLKPILIKEKNTQLVYSKIQVDKLLARLIERNYYLSGENVKLKKQMASFKNYKETMQKNHIFSPYDLEKHFEMTEKKKK